MPHRQLGVRLFPWIIALLPLQACALSGESIQGQVLEESTNKPIPGAIVVARWQGHLASFAHGQTVCVHVDSTTTDAQGKYRFPAWRKSSDIGSVRNIQPIIIVYKTGYQWSETQSKKNVEDLRSFTGTRGERLEYLLGLSGLVGCYGAGDERPLVLVYKALYDEAKEIALNDKDRDLLQTIRRRALYAWSRPPSELTAREIEKAVQNDPHLREQFR